MPVIESKLDVRSEQFARNQADMLETLGELDALYQEAARGGGEETMARLRARGKMPLRERIAMVLDPDSPFLEISPLAAWRSNFTVGSGFVVGIGVIEGVECVILGHDPSVRAGQGKARQLDQLEVAERAVHQPPRAHRGDRQRSVWSAGRPAGDCRSAARAADHRRFCVRHRQHARGPAVRLLWRNLLSLLPSTQGAHHRRGRGLPDG